MSTQPVLWRAIMSTYSDREVWRGVDALPTFYVHAPDANTAAHIACMVSGFKPEHTSGSVTGVDANLDPILDPSCPGMHPLHYLSWTRP